MPVLLNTSFNNYAEPIVRTVDDAVVCLLTTGLSGVRGRVHEPEAPIVVDVADGAITSLTTFLDGPRLLTLFAYG